MPVFLELIERQKTTLSPDELSAGIGRGIWERYGRQIDVEFPSPKSGGMWELTPKGYVGYAPVTDNLTLVLKPKISFVNVFGMLEYAFRLRSFSFLEGEVSVSSINELFDRLAAVLAGRVSDRIRRGLHRHYVTEEERLPYLRGRLLAMEAARTPWRVSLPCAFDEHTADIGDNQILHWTLDRISRSASATDRSRTPVRRAVRGLRASISLTPFVGKDCVGRRYDRLNDDYQPMHWLARFFLDHIGPVHERGERRLEPFLLDMDQLFEMFVAEWLRGHVPQAWGEDVLAQEKYVIQPQGNVHFRVDLLLRNRRSGSVRMVLDTKYKAVDHPSSDDIAQVVAYAEAHDCTDAALVYPEHPRTQLDQQIGRVRVRSLTFRLDDDLEAAGEELLSAIAPDAVQQGVIGVEGLDGA